MTNALSTCVDLWDCIGQFCTAETIHRTLLLLNHTWYDFFLDEAILTWSNRMVKMENIYYSPWRAQRLHLKRRLVIYEGFVKRVARYLRRSLGLWIYARFRGPYHRPPPRIHPMVHDMIHMAGPDICHLVVENMDMIWPTTLTRLHHLTLHYALIRYNDDNISAKQDVVVPCVRELCLHEVCHIKSIHALLLALCHDLQSIKVTVDSIFCNGQFRSYSDACQLVFQLIAMYKSTLHTIHLPAYRHHNAPINGIQACQMLRECHDLHTLSLTPCIMDYENIASFLNHVAHTPSCIIPSGLRYLCLNYYREYRLLMSSITAPFLHVQELHLNMDRHCYPNDDVHLADIARIMPYLEHLSLSWCPSCVVTIPDLHIALSQLTQLRSFCIKGRIEGNALCMSKEHVASNNALSVMPYMQRLQIRLYTIHGLDNLWNWTQSLVHAFPNLVQLQLEYDGKLPLECFILLVTSLHRLRELNLGRVYLNVCEDSFYHRLSLCEKAHTMSCPMITQIEWTCLSNPKYLIQEMHQSIRFFYFLCPHLQAIRIHVSYARSGRRPVIIKPNHRVLRNLPLHFTWEERCSQILKHHDKNPYLLWDKFDEILSRQVSNTKRQD